MAESKAMAENAAYRLAFEAVELVGAAACIDLGSRHHRYHASTGRDALRVLAARRLRGARRCDRATAAKVWRRHAPQVRQVA